VNCWEPLRAEMTTAWAGRPSATVKNISDWAISSRVAMSVLSMALVIGGSLPAEGSTTIPSGSRAQAGSKRATSFGTKIWSRLTRERESCGGRDHGARQAFQVSPSTIAGGGGNTDSKQADRDTNLAGATGALPQGYQLFWYEWRVSIHALTANLNTPGTCYVFEALQRVRRLGAAKFINTQNPLITCSLSDLTSYIDSFHVGTTNEQQTVLVNNIGFRGGKSVTVGGKPYKINPTEQIAVQLMWPGSNASYSQSYNPSTIGPTAVNVFATGYLDGVKGAPSSLAA